MIIVVLRVVGVRAEGEVVPKVVVTARVACIAMDPPARKIRGGTPYVEMLPGSTLSPILVRDTLVCLLAACVIVLLFDFDSEWWQSRHFFDGGTYPTLPLRDEAPVREVVGRHSK